MNLLDLMLKNGDIKPTQGFSYKWTLKNIEAFSQLISNRTKKELRTISAKDN